MLEQTQDATKGVIDLYQMNPASSSLKCTMHVRATCAVPLHGMQLLVVVSEPRSLCYAEWLWDNHIQTFEIVWKESKTLMTYVLLCSKDMNAQQVNQLDIPEEQFVMDRIFVD